MKTAWLVALMVLLAAGCATAAPGTCGSMSLQDLINASSATGSASGANNGCVISYGNVSYKFDYFTFKDTGSTTAVQASDIRVAQQATSNSAAFNFTYAPGSFDVGLMGAGATSNWLKMNFDIGFSLVATTGNMTATGMQLGADAYVRGGSFNLSRTVTPSTGTASDSSIYAPGWGSLFQTGNTGMFGSATPQFAVVNRFSLSNSGDLNAAAAVGYFQNTFLFAQTQAPPPPGNLDPIANPEPGTLAIVGFAIGGLAWWRRRKA